MTAYIEITKNFRICINKFVRKTTQQSIYVKSDVTFSLSKG